VHSLSHPPHVSLFLSFSLSLTHTLSLSRTRSAKEERWAKARAECAQRVTELAHFFSGEQILTRNIKDGNLQQWFLNLAKEVTAMDPADATLAGRKMQQALKF